LALILKDLFWRDRDVEHKRAFYFAHGALELYPGTNVFTPKGFLLVVQRGFVLKPIKSMA
jgi:hypothetical protein